MNVALQRAPAHASLLARLVAALAVQMPRNDDEPTHRIATAG